MRSTTYGTVDPEYRNQIREIGMDGAKNIVTGADSNHLVNVIDEPTDKMLAPEQYAPDVPDQYACPLLSKQQAACWLQHL